MTGEKKEFNMKTAAEKGARFTYYGGMTMLVERWDGYRMVFDPYISGNPSTNAPVSDFYDVDMIFVTHAAFDHYGDTADILRNSKASVVCGYEVKRMLIEQEGIEPERVLGTGYGDGKKIGEYSTARTVFAQHGSFAQIDGAWSCFSPFGFVVNIQPGVTYYHTGDTFIYSDMKMIRELYHPDVMVAGISALEEKYSREMTPREAALAVCWSGAKVAVPAHYPPGSPDLAEFIRHMESFAPDTVVKHEIGVPFTCHPFMIE